MTDRPSIEQQLAEAIGDVLVVFVAGDGENAIRAKTPDELAAAIVAAVNEGRCPPIVPDGGYVLADDFVLVKENRLFPPDVMANCEQRRREARR